MFYLNYYIRPCNLYFWRATSGPARKYHLIRIIKKLIGISVRAIRFFRMPDSRSGVKGRTIRKRMGKFYK